jgi:hypothetical protein
MRPLKCNVCDCAHKYASAAHNALVAQPCVCGSAGASHVHPLCLLDEGQEHWARCDDALCQCTRDVSFPCRHCHQIISVRQKKPHARAVRAALAESVKSACSEVVTFLTASLDSAACCVGLKAIAVMIALPLFSISIIKRDTDSLLWSVFVGALSLLLTQAIVSHAFFVFVATAALLLHATATLFGIGLLCYVTVLRGATLHGAAGCAAFALYLVAEAWLAFKLAFVHQRHSMTTFEVTASSGSDAIVADAAE